MKKRHQHLVVMQSLNESESNEETIKRKRKIGWMRKRKMGEKVFV